MQTSTILLIVVAVLVVAAAGWFLYHLQRSTQLRRRFGPEYERTLSEAGDRRTAESDLVRRAKRLERLEVRPLSPAERERFLVEWRSTQALFVDDPALAVFEANRLVNDIMTSRGYTSTNASERMENISAAYPRACQQLPGGLRDSGRLSGRQGIHGEPASRAGQLSSTFR